MRLKLLFLLGIFILPNTASAANLSVSPTSGTFSVGSSFQVQILLDTEEQMVNALDVRLRFPPDIMQVITPTAGQSIVGIWTSPPRFDNQTGEIVFQGGIPEGINVSRGLVSNITFRARGTGQASFRFGDASRVFLNDGKGTDALNYTQSGLYRFVLPPPEGPLVVSETHSDQTRWYASSDVLLRWQNLIPTSGYSFVLNETPVFNLDNIVNGTGNSVTYKDLKSGTYYFHIKALGKSGVWGGTTHFAINIDTEPPADFSVEVKPSARTTNKNLFLYFSTTDTHSGLDYYEYNVIPLSPKYFVEKANGYQTFFVETDSPEVVELGLGKYDVIVRAYDKAGNIRESVKQVRIMTPFIFYATSKLAALLLIVLILVLFLYHRKIQKWYKELENRREHKVLPDDIKNKIEELKSYREKYGKLSVFVGVFLLSFFLFSGTTIAEESITLTPPLVSTVSRNISNEDIFYIGGKTENSGIDVFIYIQNLRTGETRNFIATSDNKGDWFYRHSDFLSSGEYLLWTQAVLGNLTSPPGPQVTVNVRQTALQFGSNRLSFETLYLIGFILLFIVLVVLSLWTGSIVSRGRKKHLALTKEIKEAEESVRMGFAVLKRGIEAELSVIHKVKLNKNLSEEERQKEEQLLKDLSEMERYIGKEVWDMEKYV